MNDASLVPVQKRRTVPKAMSKATKSGSITKQTNPPLDRSSEAKQVNKSINPQPIKMATPSGREPVMIDKRAKSSKLTKPVRKAQLKTKPTGLAKEIKKTTERKGAVVKKESQKGSKK